ncbi:unnamed protein product [Staurois parvus]|uniref:Uncharacterized protein n=1 Tax=Staurois parvus TaxID=386267 RepID=A0ABN9FKW2_9NEOB|nr:unnamed protein product [Staurois parvus]
MILHFWGVELFITKKVLSPVSFCTLLCMAVHSTAMQSSVLTVKHKHSPVCKTA